MSCTDDIIKRFNEFEDAMKSCLPKVDTKMIIGLLHELKEEDAPMYNLQVYLKENPNVEEFRNAIIKDLGVVPGMNEDDHAVVEHRVNFKILEYLSNLKDVEKIIGFHMGGGRSSRGPALERDDYDKLSGNVKY